MKIFGKKRIALDQKKMAWIFAAVFVASMLPVWYLSFYAAPTGDDYGYGVLTHGAWLDTHSVWQVLKAGVETSKSFYQSWNGDWFTVFLFSLMPDVFVPGTYWIACLFMTAVLIGATSYFMYEILVRTFGLSKEYFVMIDMVVLFLSYQFIPSMKIGVYWYTGAVHYILPHAILLLGWCWILSYFRTGKDGWLFLTVLCSVMIGGSSYQCSLLWFLGLLAAVVFGTKKNRKMLLLLIPFVIWLAAFMTQCASPGNKVRAGEEFGFSASWALQTVFLAIGQSVGAFVRSFSERTLLWVFMLLVALLGWKALAQRRGEFRFHWPLIVLVFLFGCYSANFAPAIYSNVEVSSGPETENYLFALLALSVAVLYCEGWLQQYLTEKKNMDLVGENDRCYGKIMMIFLLFFGVMLIWQRREIRTSSDMQIYEYVSSGQAEDFKAQIASQMEILLDDSIKEAYLCPINDEQGPLMHMPVTADPDKFTNWATKNYYRKDKVVMVQDE